VFLVEGNQVTGVLLREQLLILMTLVESVISGKIPVVSENTWLSHELERSGITGLSFNPDNIDSVYNTVKNVVNNYAEYRKKVLAISGKWAQYHNSANLVDSLLTKLPPL